MPVYSGDLTKVDMQKHVRYLLVNFFGMVQCIQLGAKKHFRFLKSTPLVIKTGSSIS